MLDNFALNVSCPVSARSAQFGDLRIVGLEIFRPYVRQLQDSEAAYVAGIIDGEGTITLTRIHRGENRRPVVSISSTEKPLLEYIRLVVGAGRITNKRPSRTHHSGGFAYVISSRNALCLLSQVTPYLHTYKLDRANLLLAEYLRLTPRNGRYSPTLHLARSAFESAIFKITTRAPNKPAAIPDHFSSPASIGT